MTVLSSVATGGLSEVQRAVRDQFLRGGSFTSVLIVLLCIVAGVLLAYVLTQMFRVRPKRKRFDSPQQLFNDLLERLNLSAPQRQLLDSMVRDLRLKQPSTILLSEILFDRSLVQWRDARHGAGADRQLVGQVRAALFPKTF